MLISYTLDEGLQPWALRVRLCELPEEFPMRRSVDPELGRAVRLPFVDIIEPTNC